MSPQSPPPTPSRTMLRRQSTRQSAKVSLPSSTSPLAPPRLTLPPPQGEWIPSAGEWPVDPQDDVEVSHDRIWVDGCFDFSHHGTS
ncbi:hypothetical protein BS50DRAFT_571892 [Corynespora cassiicola Philippines]|uniref:Uncharacterized protein n=1 Tax=Corynespora cassiicola Philippines TaxID=1448308 RepID=A0A2T2NTD0_CORCC|nr:hypothetical protein BS50DRAFT_571892 [Corynespora cassiicola Philippines]